MTVPSDLSSCFPLKLFQLPLFIFSILNVPTPLSVFINLCKCAMLAMPHKWHLFIKAATHGVFLAIDLRMHDNSAAHSFSYKQSRVQFASPILVSTICHPSSYIMTPERTPILALLPSLYFNCLQHLLVLHSGGSHQFFCLQLSSDTLFSSSLLKIVAK